MKNSYINSFCSNIIQFNFLFALTIFVLTLTIFYFSNNSSKQFLIKSSNSFNLVKFLLILELVVLLISNNSLLFIYASSLKTLNTTVTYSSSSVITNLYSIPINLFTFSINVDFIGLIFCTLAFFVGLVSLLALDTRFY